MSRVLSATSMGCTGKEGGSSRWKLSSKVFLVWIRITIATGLKACRKIQGNSTSPVKWWTFTWREYAYRADWIKSWNEDRADVDRWNQNCIHIQYREHNVQDLSIHSLLGFMKMRTTNQSTWIAAKNAPDSINSRRITSPCVFLLRGTARISLWYILDYYKYWWSLADK